MSGALASVKPEPAGSIPECVLSGFPWVNRADLSPGAGVPCRVEEVLYQGASRSIHLRAGERRLLVEDANDGASARVRVGETTAVSWRPEDGLVLPR